MLSRTLFIQVWQHHEKMANSEKSKNRSKDHLVYWVLLLLGFCTGLPWGVVTNFGSLFEARLKGTTYGDAFIPHFATIFLLVKVIFLFVSVNLLASFRPQKQLAISAPFLSLSMLGFATICSIEFENKFNFYVLNLALSVFVSFFSAMFKAGNFGIIGMLPSLYLKALFIGEGTSSLIMAFYSLVLGLSSMKAEKTQAFVTFGLASAVILNSFLVYSAVGKRPVFHQHQIKECDKEKGDCVEKLKHESIPSLISQVPCPALSAFLSGAVSLFIFSYVLSHTESVNPGTKLASREVFRPLAMLVFPLGDLVGKMLPTLRFFNRPNLPLLRIVLARTALIPFFLLGNFQVNGKNVFPLIFKSDALFFFLVFAASSSGGYGSTMASLAAPKKVPLHERGRVTTILAAISLMGNLVGSFGSSIFAFIISK